MIVLKKYKKRYFSKVYEFLYNNYTFDRSRGVNASFFAYSLLHIAMDKKNISQNGVWFDDKRIVAFCSYEMHLGEAFFSYQKEYEFLLDEMITFSEKNLRDNNNRLLMHPFSTQVLLRQKLKERGYRIIDSWPMKHLSLNEPFYHPLPKGYYFLEEEVDFKKLELCLHKGFDHGEKTDKYHPKEYKKVFTSPYATSALSTIIVNSNNEYVTFAGMWYEKDNHLAYLEPLCTIPEERKKGLASSAIGNLCKKLSKLGATHMSGGADEFYSKLGFKEIYRDELWEKR